MSYSDLYMTDLAATRKLHLEIFMEIAKIIQIHKTYSLEDIKEQCKKNHKVLSEVITNSYRDCFECKLKDGDSNENLEPSHILVSLTEKGLVTFFQHANI